MLKQSILAVAISTLMLTGCQSTSQSTISKNFETTTPTSIVQTPLDFGGENITLEQAMADPDWLGRQPESALWGADSNSIVFKQKREGSVVRDLYKVKLSDNTVSSIPLSKLHTVVNRDAISSPDGQFQVYTFEGNIFTKNGITAEVRQLTFGSENVRIDQFLTNGLLAYSKGTSFFTLDVNTGISKELVNLHLVDAPKGVQEPQTLLSKNQLRLIKYIQVQHKNAKDREAYKNEVAAQNDFQFKNDFYLGKGKELVAVSLSPSGKALVVAFKDKKAERSEHDIMPHYVNSDGNIHPKAVRQRVAESTPQNTDFMFIDLEAGEQKSIDLSSMPGFDEDVLAAVKAENAKAKGEKYESKKAPRSINLIEDWAWREGVIQWSSDGSKVAMMIEAWDNKDRWLVTLNADGKSVTTQHRLHDDAWVNYNFNQFGWLHNSSTLYYLSEETGYSQLYLKPVNSKAKRLTDGKFEVSDLTVTKDDQYIYFKSNQKHPGIYEVYRVNTVTGDVNQLTDLNGMTDYKLSPDEQNLLLTHSTIMLPTELYVTSAKGGDKVTRLTYTVSDDFLNKKLIAPKIVAVKSSHTDAPIYAKVYYPADYKEGESGKTRKAVIFNHGAGYLQNSHFGWSGYFREFMFHSLLAQEGYVVMDMDYRASKGYGRDWRTAIYRQMGTPEIQDLADGVTWMAENANVNVNSVGTYGGSYGGFMTFMALFTQPDLFQAGAALRPVADWNYYNHGYTSNILNLPDVDPIAYERSSPIFHAEGLKKPLLINAPMVDDNVFFQGVVRLVQRLIELEKTDFETAIFPVEPHGFVQPSSWLDEYRRIHKLFEENLK